MQQLVRLLDIKCFDDATLCFRTHGEADQVIDPVCEVACGIIREIAIGHSLKAGRSPPPAEDLLFTQTTALGLHGRFAPADPQSGSSSLSSVSPGLHLYDIRKKGHRLRDTEIGKLACKAAETLDSGDTAGCRGRAQIVAKTLPQFRPAPLRRRSRRSEVKRAAIICSSQPSAGSVLNAAGA